MTDKSSTSKPAASRGYAVIGVLLLTIGVISSVFPFAFSNPAPIPGVLPQGTVASEVQSQVRAALAPNIDSADPQEEVEAEIQRRSEDIVSELFETEEPSELRQRFSAHVQQAIRKAYENGAFRPRVASDNEANEAIRTQKQQLYREILLSFIFADQAAANVPTDEQLRHTRDRITRIFDIPDSDSQFDQILKELISARDKARVFRLKGEARENGLLKLLTPKADDPVASPDAGQPRASQ